MLIAEFSIRLEDTGDEEINKININCGARSGLNAQQFASGKENS